MTRAEDVAYARAHARKTAARSIAVEARLPVPRWKVFDSAAQEAAYLAAVHLADSHGDDLALVWAREQAHVFRTLRDASTKARRRTAASIKAVL